MTESKDQLVSDRMIKQGLTYDHAEHGRVEVTGIWKGVHQIDSAHNATETGIVIVRYLLKRDDRPSVELTETLDEFLEAIE